MPGTQLLAIDQGTHATRAIVFDAQGRALAVAQRPVAIRHPADLRAEQSAEEIVQSVHAVIREVTRDPAVDPPRIRAAGLATQRSSAVAWDRLSGEPLSPVLGWQDRRGEPQIAALAALASDVECRTGLRLSAHYGASKLAWLLRHEPAVQAARASGRLSIGPLASFLAFHLLRDRPLLVDHANASRTLLWNLSTRDWDAQMLGRFEITGDLLPECRPITGEFGRLAVHDIPLAAMNGDQTAALYADGMPADDTLLINIGTGAFVLLPVDDPGARPPGLLAGISHSDAAAARYYLEGTVNGAGAAVDWAARELAIGRPDPLLPDCLPDAGDPPLFINTVGGLGSPWWRPDPAPRFLSPPGDACRALAGVVESIVFLLQANIELLCRHRPAARAIRISGGLAQIDGLCQRIADLSGLEVRRALQVEATARGIAWLAAGGPSEWRTEGAGQTFRPRVNARLQSRYRRFLSSLSA